MEAYSGLEWSQYGVVMFSASHCLDLTMAGSWKGWRRR